MSLIDTGSCGSSEPFALRVIGDDMAPEFENNHIIIVDPGGQLKSGCFVVARVGSEDEGDVILRQLMIVGDDYRLQSLKTGNVNVVLNRADCDLLGVVSQRAGKRRKNHKRYD
jgi:SOS-response transcriptional repressor LexA|tara:strand:+ start:1874 stop:2212 length:339 start_codon:yes stop_codon:yes gene_type:complete